MGANEEKISDNTTGNTLNSQRFILAVVMFISYLAFITYLVIMAGKDDSVMWTKLLYLFTGIETIVFAALGYVFGQDINRKRAENAENALDNAKQEEANAKVETEKAKKEAQKEREKGIALSTAIKSTSSNDQTILESFSAEGTSGNSTNNISFLTKLAYELYPKESEYVEVDFKFDITPADNIKKVTINKEDYEGSNDMCFGVPVFDNRFKVHVDRVDDKKDWTIKVTEICDSNGKKRKQLNGKMESSYPSAYVQLENL